MLEIEDVHAGYDAGNVLQGVTISIKEGEVVALVGRNGVGKSTLIRTVMGEVIARKGSVRFLDQEILNMASYERAHLGLGYVPQGRDVFPLLTVEENLHMGQFINKQKTRMRYDMVYEYFPILKRRLSQKAGTMSGGEQQMLSIGRALVGDPLLLLLDEPSQGVQPTIVREIGESVKGLNLKEGLTVLLVEQNLDLMQALAQRAYVMDKGRVLSELSRQEVLDTERITSYLAI
ncbi:MAG: ABC transporter ATP-binding protein [Deltaproteobacteria bacterium]|nr:ABC transporter ATP-binding protein [Deltaproteobacteria bacterium]